MLNCNINYGYPPNPNHVCYTTVHGCIIPSQGVYTAKMTLYSATILVYLPAVLDTMYGSKYVYIILQKLIRPKTRQGHTTHTYSSA